MHEVTPKVYLIGEPRVLWDGPHGLNAYLEAVGAPDWQVKWGYNNEYEPTDLGVITEAMGRLCYRSFKPGLNPNVTAVRESHKDYIENILKVGHGSVIEHGMLNFIFHNFSRVFTHELVRHRPGVAISQESLRFVRLDELGLWLPTVIREHEGAREVFYQIVTDLEQAQLRLAEMFGLDEVDANDKPVMKFALKKVITSAMRRIAPDGLATTIGWSANMRALRHTGTMRTERHAEEEIRLGFHMALEIAQPRYRPFLDDFEKVAVEGSDIPEWKPKYVKV